MELLYAEEWTKGFRTVKGTDVFCSGSGKVRAEWLSSCREKNEPLENIAKVGH